MFKEFRYWLARKIFPDIIVETTRILGDRQLSFEAEVRNRLNQSEQLRTEQEQINQILTNTLNQHQTIIQRVLVGHNHLWTTVEEKLGGIDDLVMH